MDTALPASYSKCVHLKSWEIIGKSRCDTATITPKFCICWASTLGKTLGTIRPLTSIRSLQTKIKIHVPTVFEILRSHFYSATKIMIKRKL